MTFLSTAEKQQIADAIRVAEANTQGELVCVIAPASNDYRFVPLLWAALMALSLPAFVWLAQGWWTQAEVYLAQVALFLLALLFLQWSPVKMRLVPRSSQRKHAARRAREQFYAQQLHHTRNRTGVLLFVSVAEHYVEILADEGINAKVAPGTWDHIIKNFVAQLGARRIAPGFLEAVAACATILAEHSPAHKENHNELPNHLIELE